MPRSPPDAIRAASERLTAWLLDDALPIWWERAADHAGGGYFDRLNLDGTVAQGPKRLRVQSRQAYVYALAPSLGWTGPAKPACRQGINAVLERRCADGLYRTTPDWVGLHDGMALIYDQAFVLLALASECAAFGNWGQEDVALRLAAQVDGFTQDGGFVEMIDQPAPLFANPNMHLFECFQAWGAVSAHPTWRAASDRIARFAQDRLYVAAPGARARGAILEHYGAHWAAPPSASERAIWPGHLYEWAFLLLQHDPGDHARGMALKLIETAERAGVDANGVVIFALDGDFAPTDRGARLWAQTERLRACARAAALTGDGAMWDAALQAYGALEAFLDVPTPGLWRDWMEPTGAFREEAAPASSLYHIIGAIAELARQTSTSL